MNKTAHLDINKLKLVISAHIKFVCIYLAVALLTILGISYLIWYIKVSWLILLLLIISIAVFTRIHLLSTLTLIKSISLLNKINSSKEITWNTKQIDRIFSQGRNMGTKKIKVSVLVVSIGQEIIEIQPLLTPNHSIINSVPHGQH